VCEEDWIELAEGVQAIFRNNLFRIWGKFSPLAPAPDPAAPESRGSVSVRRFAQKGRVTDCLTTEQPQCDQLLQYRASFVPASFIQRINQVNKRRSIMGKYLMIWTLNQALTPVDSKERGGGYQLLMTAVKQDIAKGLTKDWGNFVGEGSGYCVVEGSEVEINKMVQQYAPYVMFKTHPVASVEQVDEMLKSLSG
jgi:hypothetical protein